MSTLDRYGNEDRSNKFCRIGNLRNESDVEQFFLLPLLNELGYDQDYIETKATINEVSIGKGTKRKNYKPDYICYADKQHLKPVLIIDAKHPITGQANEGIDDAQLYTAVLRRNLDAPKPEQYCIGSNGVNTEIYHYESNIPHQQLVFDDFIDGNPKFESMKTEMGRTARAKAITVSTQPFEFKKSDPKELPQIFEKCHTVIWRKEVSSPAFAFYEFSKIMFVKLKHDKKLREDPEIKKLIDAQNPLPREKVTFSVHWIAQNEHVEPNPINNMFRQLRDALELEILQKKKKRIFESNEEIRLKTETVKTVVRLLEHYDLYGMDEDINGRLFETFLSATMRGKALGQFFTPRSVVEFMTELAELKADNDHVDMIIDGCCGTGGFLIQAMAKMMDMIRQNQSLSGSEKAKLIEQIRDEHLFGIDAGKEPPVARIARINMYLHGDGGSRIYFADALDRQILIEDTLPPELKDEREELRKILVEGKKKFDVVLTNPPFAMPYKKAEADQRRVLEQYDLAFVKKKGKRKLKASLKTNVMFLMRYHDLLEEGGKLVTIIDESVLNTDTDKSCRDFIYENYLVRAIISLPRMTFLRAGANVKTSILYLEKKRDKSEEQPYTFYARCENSGCDPRNLRKIDPSKSDLKGILVKFREFQRTGQI